MTTALKGVKKLLLISSSEVGQRATQHQNVINAAKAAGVTFIAYTSLLHADNSPLGLHVEHVATEKLRNGWYTENYGERAACWNTACYGAAGGAPAPPVRITGGGGKSGFGSHAGNVYELAGDSAWQANWRLNRASRVVAAEQNMSEADFAAALKSAACLPGWRICWRTLMWAHLKAGSLTIATR